MAVNLPIKKTTCKCLFIHQINPGRVLNPCWAKQAPWKKFSLKPKWRSSLKKIPLPTAPNSLKQETKVDQHKLEKHLATPLIMSHLTDI
jgi:hypothetical protein